MSAIPLSKEIAGQLDADQADAIRAFGPRTLVIAGAGSGKTRVLTFGLAHLLDDHHMQPEEVILLTFTRKASETMRERAAEVTGRDLDNLRCGTFHSVGALMLRSVGRDFSIIDESEAVTMIKQLGAELFQEREIYGFVQMDPERLYGWFSKAKEEDLTLEEVLWEAPELYRDSHRLISDLYDRFTERKEHESQLDYSDLLYETRELLQSIDGASILKGIRAVLVDEVQDLNQIQRQIIDALTSDGAWLVEVGDAEQCQPAGTLVQTTDGLVAIEDLQPAAHKVISYERIKSRSSLKQEGSNFEIAQRQYQGFLFTVTAAGRSSNCTSGHKWPIKWEPDAPDTLALTLLHCQGQWRLDWCRLDAWEYADEDFDVWILRVCHSDAEMAMLTASAYYGISVAHQEPVQWLSEKEQERRAIACLQAHDKDISYPMWTVDDDRANPNCHATNLLPSLMSVAFEKEGQVMWAPVSVEKGPFHGMVYSLKVLPYQTYVADGLITHNSIYRWRGASYEALHELAEQPGVAISKLETNYRSAREIVLLSKEMIPPSKLALNVKAFRGPSGIAPKLLQPEDEGQEFTAIANWAQNALKDPTVNQEDLCVLARAHDHLKNAVNALTSEGLSIDLLGRRQGPFEDARQYLMCLMRLALNNHDSAAWQKLLPTFGFDVEEQYARLVTLRDSEHPLETCANWAFESPVASVLLALKNEEPSSYLWNKLCLGPFGTLLAMNLSDPQRAAGLITDLSIYGQRKGEGTAYINNLLLGDENDELAAGVRVGTVHASKGLEWKHVLVVRCSYESFPSKMSVIEDGLDEERRLFYVAVTRAEDTITVCEAPWLSGGERHQVDFLSDRNIYQHFSH